jgi:hypothetical protein
LNSNRSITVILQSKFLFDGKEQTMWSRHLVLAAACVIVWPLVIERAWSQSVVGAGTVPFIRLGQQTGSGTPQGVLAAAGHIVNGVPVGALRVRITDGTITATATVDVDCIHLDGERIAIGGPIRSGTVTNPGAANFTHVYLVVEDNGTPINGMSVDRALAFAATMDFCESPEILFLLFDVFYDFTSLTRGNFIVQAGAP